MKKGLIALVLLGLSFGLVGCKVHAEAPTNNGVVSEETSKEENKRSSDEMYEIYTSKLEEVEKLFRDNKIEFREEKDNKNKKYKGITTIAYENSNNKAINEFVIGRYGIAFDNNGEIKYITAKMSLNVNDDDMKTKEFKFEDTEFCKLTNALASDIKNYDEINKKVNNYYNGNDSSVIDLESGKIKQTIVLGDNCIDYIILINP